MHTGQDWWPIIFRFIYSIENRASMYLRGLFCEMAIKTNTSGVHFSFKQKHLIMFRTFVLCASVNRTIPQKKKK